MQITVSIIYPGHSGAWSGRIPERKEGNVLFNDALNIFYLQLYAVGHNYDKGPLRERENNPLPALYGLLIPSSSKAFLCAPSYKQDSTHHGLCYTSCGALAGRKPLPVSFHLLCFLNFFLSFFNFFSICWCAFRIVCTLFLCESSSILFVYLIFIIIINSFKNHVIVNFYFILFTSIHSFIIHSFMHSYMLHTCFIISFVHSVIHPYTLFNYLYVEVAFPYIVACAIHYKRENQTMQQQQQEQQ